MRKSNQAQRYFLFVVGACLWAALFLTMLAAASVLWSERVSGWQLGTPQIAATPIAASGGALAVPPGACVTVEKMVMGYANTKPGVVISKLNPKPYIAAFNALPPISQVTPPDVLLLADDPASPRAVVLLDFRGGCLKYIVPQPRTVHDQVMKLLGQGV